MVARAIDILLQYWREQYLNRFPGMGSMLLQRITGIGIVIYLLMHITVIGSVVEGPERFDAMMARVQNPPIVFKPLEFLLMVALLAHALNGLRITAVEFGGLAKYHRASVAVMAALFVPLVCIGGYVFYTHIVGH